MTAPDVNADVLLPCPFCGPGESVVEACFDDMAHRWRVYCGRCGCSTGIHPRDKTKTPAIEAWNHRAAHADLAGEEVEFCSVCRKLFGPTETRVGTGDGTMRANNGRGSFAHRHCYEAAALAKFHPTHQEKP